MSQSSQFSPTEKSALSPPAFENVSPGGSSDRDGEFLVAEVIVPAVTAILKLREPINRSNLTA